MKDIQKVALIAHDNKKPEIIEWAKKNKEIITRYTVVNNEILEIIYANPDDKKEANSLEYLYFEFNQNIKKNISSAVLTDKDGNEYPLEISDIDTWGGNCAENALCLKTATPIIAPGEYTFVMKKDYVCASGDNSLTIKKDVTYKFIVVESLKIKEITPNSSDIYDEVSEITFLFNKLAYHNNISELVVKDNKNNSYKFTKTTTEEESESLTFTASAPLTTAGTYSFTIEGNLIYCENTNSDLDELESIPETTFTFIVKYPTSIEGIDAETEDNDIYDLSGRRVERITNAGIYISKNKKTIIK